MGIARFANAGRRLVSSAVLVFLVALVVRLGVLFELLPAHAWIDFYPRDEPSRIAWALVSGLGYSSPWPRTVIAPTAQQPPLYPLLLAGIFKMAGAYSLASLWIAAGLNALFSALTAVMILRLGKREFGEAVGVVAAWTWAVWVYEAATSVRLWESSLSALMLTIALLWLPKLKDSVRMREWAWFGIFAALASSTNATFLAIFPMLWLWLWVRRRAGDRGHSRAWLLSVVVAVACLVPWTVRNYRVFHRFIPMRDNFGLELWIGNHEGGDALETINDFPLFDPTLYNRLGEIAFMEQKRQIAMRFIGQHPREFLHLCGHRCVRYWSAPSGSAWPLISLLAGLGLLLLISRKRWDGVPYVIVVVMFPLIYYVTHSIATYRHPIEPVLILLAVYAVRNGVEVSGRISARIVSYRQTPDAELD